jgi:hypothetical protein
MGSHSKRSCSTSPIQPSIPPSPLILPSALFKFTEEDTTLIRLIFPQPMDTGVIPDLSQFTFHTTPDPSDPPFYRIWITNTILHIFSDYPADAAGPDTVALDYTYILAKLRTATGRDYQSWLSMPIPRGIF